MTRIIRHETPKEIEVPLTLATAASFVERHATDDSDDAMSGMISAARGVSESAAKIVKAVNAARRNKMGSPLANEKAARDASWKAWEAASTRADRAYSHARTVAEHLEKAMVLPRPKDAVEATNALAVQQALAKMNPAERMKYVKDRLDDDALVAAVLSGHELVSGITEAEKGVIASDWRLRRHGEKFERLGRLGKAQEDLARIQIQFSNWIHSLRAEHEEAIAAAEASEQAAKAALRDAAA